MLSCVLLLPLDQVATGNAVGEAMGWGPASYSVPLSADGSEPATHYGLHTWGTQAFVDMLDAGVMPARLVYPQADFDAVMAALVQSVRADMTGHFAEVCATNGLVVVV